MNKLKVDLFSEGKNKGQDTSKHFSSNLLISYIDVSVQNHWKNRPESKECRITKL